MAFIDYKIVYLKRTENGVEVRIRVTDGEYQNFTENVPTGTAAIPTQTHTVSRYVRTGVRQERTVNLTLAQANTLINRLNTLLAAYPGATPIAEQT